MNEMVRIAFEVEDGRETMWAFPLGDDTYEIRSLPFRAYGVCWGDVVKAHKSNEGLEFDALVRRSGHSCYRVFLSNTLAGHFEESSQWQELQKLGSTYEQASRRLIAIDVPPESDVRSVYEVLEQGERDKAWDFEEVSLGHIRHGSAK
jgi:hypothetical protein